jgi:hypothetical protein
MGLKIFTKNPIQIHPVLGTKAEMKCGNRLYKGVKPSSNYAMEIILKERTNVKKHESF